MNIEVEKISSEGLRDVLKVLNKHNAEYTLLEVPSKRPLDTSLSDKSIKVIELLADGYSYEEIAKALGITIDGARYYIKRIYKSFGVNNCRAAIKVFNNIRGNTAE